MVDSFTQRARMRKLVYTVLILILFTGSLLHRELLLKRQAFHLQLQEKSRGEVELTSSAVRLLLTGSRGLVVTFLWATAIKDQQLHKWNEVEQTVNSITKLQPYFVTAWLFQSWNLAFNVAVECDRPRDKYYYVSRGLELLAEGERRNRGSGDELRPGDDSDDDGQRPRFPGNPDMRHHLGFTLQLKIGTSDEKTTMQCLLDLSCIDPARRDPQRFQVATERGLEVNEEALQKFCEQNPRLVRRLHDVLGYSKPSQIVGFLQDNGGVPGRFKTPGLRGLGQPLETPLKEPREQFPILPPQLLADWPNPETRDLTPETVDVFLVARTWYSYAQLPLPPEKSDPGLSDPRYRKPRHMQIVLFRAYPAHAQRFSAETLEAEGFFDKDGWLIEEWWPSWFRSREIRKDLRVGSAPKYHAGLAWDKAYRLYRDYGERTGQYLSAAQGQMLEDQAHLYRKTFQVKPFESRPLPSELNHGAMARSYQAHHRLAQNRALRELTNFDTHLFTTQAEKQAGAVLARKLCFEADWLKRVKQDPGQALARYEEAWPVWLDLLLTNPDYRRLAPTQEDLCDLQIKYALHLLQKYYANELFRPLTIGLAQAGVWPHAGLDKLLSDNDRQKILPIRNFRNPFEMIAVYDGPLAPDLQRWLLAWTAGPQLAHGAPFAGLVNLAAPGQLQRLLTASLFFSTTPHPDWKPLLEEGPVQSVRDRLSLPKTATK